MGGYHQTFHGAWSGIAHDGLKKYTCHTCANGWGCMMGQMCCFFFGKGWKIQTEEVISLGVVGFGGAVLGG